jgi:hypothetical protein
MSMLARRFTNTLPHEANDAAHVLTFAFCTGLPSPGDGDAHLPRAYRPSAVYMAPKAFYLHLGEPHHCKAAVWHEGRTT